MENLHPGIKKAWTVEASIIDFAVSISFTLLIFAAFKTDFLTTTLIFFLFFVPILLFSVIWINLSYNNYKFELRDEGIFIEKGVITKKYQTVPYSRIQNVDMYRGIFARIFGYTELMIETAGYSGGYQSSAPMIILGGKKYPGIGIPLPIGGGGGSSNPEGHIPAIDSKRAEEIRTWLIKKVSEK
ncbi:MAG: PH domain-containing protein [Candidatus Aenigmatarchaeota archaeon]